MQWFYALDGQRFGPVSLEDFARLVAAGTVTSETLVWREGLPNWVAWGTIAADTTLPEVSGEAGPPPETPAFDGDTAAGGAGEASTDWSLEEFTAKLRENGFSFSVEGGLRRTWRNMTNGYLLALGVVLVASLIMIVAGMVPIIGLAASFIVTPQLTAGMSWFFLCRSRGEQPSFDTVFDGYRKRFGSLALVALLQLAVGIVVAIGFFLLMLPFGFSLEAIERGEPMAPAAGAAFFVVIFILGLVVTLLAARFSLVHTILMDQSMGVIDAFKLSWRITGMRFWSLLGLAIIVVVINIAAALLLLLPLILVAPLVPAAFAQVYEDARLSAAGTPPEQP